MKKLFLVLVFNLVAVVNAQPRLQNAIVFSGNSNKKLSEKIAESLKVPLGKILVSKFNDGEIQIKIEENVRGKDVFIIQPTCSCNTQSVNDSLMELYLLVRTMKRASTKSITIVVPYYGYARQDRKTSARVPISASDVAIILETAGVDRVLVIDLHCGQIQGFFRNIPVDNLYACPIFVSHFANKNLDNIVVVSPDAGGAERANKFVQKLAQQGIYASMAIISKRREKPGKVGSMQLIGDVTNANAIIIDDMCDSGGTLAKASELLKKHGAKKVFAAITHPVFSGQALKTIANSTIDEMIISDTISLKEEPPKNITIVSVSKLLAEAICRIQNQESISELFD